MSEALTYLSIGVVVVVLLGFRIWAEAKDAEALRAAFRKKVFQPHLSNKGNKE